MKKLLLIPFSICLSFGAIANETSEEPQEITSERMLGTDWFASLKKNFDEGQYEDFLAELNLEYKEAVESGALPNLDGLFDNNPGMNAEMEGQMKSFRKRCPAYVRKQIASL